MTHYFEVIDQDQPRKPRKWGQERAHGPVHMAPVDSLCVGRIAAGRDTAHLRFTPETAEASGCAGEPDTRVIGQALKYLDCWTFAGLTSDGIGTGAVVVRVSRVTCV